MFVSVLLLSRRWTPGRQWIGKHRRVVKVTRTQRQTVEQRKQKVQEVLARLSTPYLTELEDTGHAKLRKAEEYREWREHVRKRWGVKNIKNTPFPQLQSPK